MSRAESVESQVASFYLITMERVRRWDELSCPCSSWKWLYAFSSGNEATLVLLSLAVRYRQTRTRIYACRRDRPLVFISDSVQYARVCDMFLHDTYTHIYAYSFHLPLSTREKWKIKLFSFPPGIYADVPYHPSPSYSCSFSCSFNSTQLPFPSRSLRSAALLRLSGTGERVYRAPSG